jgi:alpha-galactosidase
LIAAMLLIAIKTLSVAYNNGAPHSRLPVLGWSSWVALGPGAEHPVFDYCDEFSVMQSIDAFVEVGFYEAGYRHFHLDDCWAGGRFDNGTVYPEQDHFPNGMKKVIDYAHKKGLSFGLYTCGGTKTCVGGRPGSRDHWTNDAVTYSEWGVDWVKMDWCNSAPQDPKKTYPIMSSAMNKTGRPMHFNMCEWGKENPWEWGDAVAQSWRMSGDHTGVWKSTKQQIQLSAAIPAEYSGVPYGWNDMDMLETGNGERAAHANNKLSNMTDDEWITEFSMWSISASPLTVTTPIMNCTPAKHPNMTKPCSVSLKKQLSQSKCAPNDSFGCNQDGTMFTKNGCRGEFVCDGNAITASVDGDGTHTFDCLGGTDVTCVPWITPLQRKILFNKEAIAVNQDVTPQGRPLNDSDISLWTRGLSDGTVAVAMYNENDAAMDMSLQFEALAAKHGSRWSATTKAVVRNLWEFTNTSVTGRFPESGTHTVRPHQTVLLRLYAQ